MSNGDGIIRSLVGQDFEGFRQEFESFLDQCPSFLYRVGTGRFLPVLFFSMFATAHDAGILAPDERVYIRFDNHGIDTGGKNRSTGNLKVAVLTNKFHGKKRIVRCYSISDVPNSDGLRFSEREINALVREIRRQNPDLREEGLSFEQYKVCMHGKGKSQGEKGAVVFEAIREKGSEGRDRFAKYSASEISLLRHIERDRLREINAPAPFSVLTIKEIEGMVLNQNQRGQLDTLINFAQVEPGQQRIDGFIGMLASNNEENTERQINEEILPYITRIYRHYAGTLENNIQNRNQKFESHGLFLGLLANFSHLYTIDIDLNLSLVNSYVAFLVHHQAERENIPIVINTGWRTSFALERARGDAKRLHASSFISIHTESRHAVCVGLNFNSRLAPFRVGIAELQQNRFPLVQRLFEYVEDEEIGENIRDFLLQHLLAEIPRNAENRDRILDCITGFAFGNSAFDHEQVLIQNNRLQVIKYIFRYDNEDLRKHALAMVFHAQGFPIVMLDIRNPHDIQSVKAIALPPGYNGAVNRVTYILNNQYGLNVLLDRFNSPNHYLNRNRYASFDGNLIEVPNAENVHNTLNQVMNDGWQSIAQHRELLRAISRVLMPENMNGSAIIDVSNNDKFRSILHGIFYVCDNPDKVVTEYRVGQTYSPDIRMAGEIVEQVSTRVAEQRLGLLLLRSTINHPEDTHPIGYVLGFANTEQTLAQEQRNTEQQITRLMDKQRGYLPITSGNEVVLSYAVFYAGAQRAENLISFPQEVYIHRFNRDDTLRRVGLRQPVRLVGPNSVIDENPPENLLSDIISKRLIDYFQGNQKQSSIPLFNLGNNQWVAFRYLEGDKEQVIRRLRFGTDETLTAQGILERINNILRDHDRGTIQDVNDLITLDFATENGYYRYWFQQHDITYVARAQGYNFLIGNEMRFHIMGIENGQVDVLKTHIESFKDEGGVGPRRSILIVNLGGNHWVTLVIDYRNGNYIGYYADSLGHDVPHGITRTLEDNSVTLHNVLIDQQGGRLVQQRGGYNCGFWALENARDINEVLQQNNNLGNQGRGMLGEMRNSLTLNVPGLNNIVDENNLRNEEYFKGLRRDISRELQDVNTNAGRARSDDAGDPNSVMSFIINNQNNPEISRLLLEYLKLTFPHVQSLHFDEEQQAALLQFVSSSFPNASIELVKQGLYLPSFEKRGVNINGKCVAITRGLSQALSLHKDKSLLNNLKTSAEIYERIAQGKQISKREEKEAFAFSKLLSNFEEQVDCVTSTLPSSLTHSRSYKMLSDLSNYIAEINDDFALHLVTSNHVVAIYRIGDSYTYFDSNAAFISELKSVDQLMQVVEKGIEFAGYEMGEKGFLIEHFDVNQANGLLDDEDKQTLTREIKTERELLAEQDKELGLIKIDGQEVSRVQLYDFGTKINVKGSVPLLINADMKLNSKKFLDYLDKKEVSITAREYLDNLQNSKNVKEVVQATKAIPFEGSNQEVKEAEHQRSQELKFSMKQLIKYLLTAVIRQKSQLSEDNSKADDNPNHYLSSVTISSQPKESQRY
ncbi:cytoplasmic incompatibility factor CifB [Wolbachia endosymbiont of Phyllotreta cruciferae]|uniref:cytoplasmic incompatibility factor CifB n=1 Tax=Wolbachia endosymbiont of Phyllotreta cruciferae TaxID=2886377 RepID=UPI00273A7337|nr:cytoplasmic incompatibility factor CifB [Wolbachia endosymbiont of Phyllotreta cruciferae]